MPRFAIKDLMVAIAFISAGNVLLRLVMVDVDLNYGLPRRAAEIFTVPIVLLCLWATFVIAWTLISAGLAYPLKRVGSGVVVGVIGSLIYMSLVVLVI